MVQETNPISRSLEALGAITEFLSGDEWRDKNSLSDSGQGTSYMFRWANFSAKTGRKTGDL